MRVLVIAVMLSGCITQSKSGLRYGVKIVEEKDTCSFQAQGAEIVDATMTDIDACIKWKGDKCEVLYGTVCE